MSRLGRADRRGSFVSDRLISAGFRPRDQVAEMRLGFGDVDLAHAHLMTKLLVTLFCAVWSGSKTSLDTQIPHRINGLHKCSPALVHNPG